LKIAATIAAALLIEIEVRQRWSTVTVITEPGKKRRFLVSQLAFFQHHTKLQSQQHGAIITA
jgi:hypothetical protein